MENLKIKIPNIHNVRIKDIISFAYLAIIIIMGLALFHGDSTLSTVLIQKVLAIILNLSFYLVWFLIVIYKQANLGVSLAIPIVYSLISYMDSYINKGFPMQTMLMMIGFLLLDQETKAQIFKWYRTFLVIISAIGIICFIAYVIHFPLPYRTVPYYTNNGLYYIDYGLAYLDVSSSTSIQLCGLFNEPGYFGTVLALVLCADEVDLKKRGNIILFIAGLFTSSLAFIIIIILYWILKSYNNPKKILFITAIAVVYIWVLPNIKINIPAIQNIIDRIIIVDGKLAGDNRIGLSAQKFLHNMLRSSHAMWGMGQGYSNSHFTGNLSFKTYLINFGIIGTFLMYGSVVWCAFLEAKKNVSAWMFIFVFIISVYQRPHIFNILFMSILFGGIARLTLEDKN